MDFDEISYTSIEKSKLRSLQNVKNRKIICQYNTTLFAGDIFCNWHNLKLNGFLTFEIDYKKKSRFFCLYEVDTLELLFQYELYNHLENYLNLCESNFLSFEVDKGFIGMQFIYDNEAISFKIFVTKFTQEYTNKIIEKKSYDFSPEYEDCALIKTREKILFDLYIDILKKNYKKESDAYENENNALMGMKKDEESKLEIAEYIEEKEKLKNLMEVFSEISIKKIKNLDLILSIDFDQKIKKFNIDNIPQEIKKVLNKNGIKKHQFTDSIFALSVFKNYIEKYDKNAGYMNFFGRIAKDSKKRKAMDWVALARKGSKKHAIDLKSMIEIKEDIKDLSKSDSESEDSIVVEK